MSTTITPDECRAYVAAHLASRERQWDPGLKHPPAVTLSRLPGARGSAIGQELVHQLARATGEEWSLFDDALVSRILEDHALPGELRQFIPDDAISGIEGTINEILGRHPSLWTLFEYTVQTIVRLARLGNCVVIGHGGNMATRGMPNVTRVLLTGSLACRKRYMVQRHGMDDKAASAFLRQQEAARQRYLRKHYATDFDDPANYDLVLHTDRYSNAAVARIIAAALPETAPGATD